MSQRRQTIFKKIVLRECGCLLYDIKKLIFSDHIHLKMPVMSAVQLSPWNWVFTLFQSLKCFQTDKKERQNQFKSELKCKARKRHNYFRDYFSGSSNLVGYLVENRQPIVHRVSGHRQHIGENTVNGATWVWR